ncbi:gliding motility-associated C-terminal domain-containing protein [Flagellimonas sp. 389]|nr:gliding motility-associated C-terminal domain-containing protein [Flagellimonas sp. 389]
MGQDAVQNFGNLQFHNTASVGFHIDLIDNGTFDQNLGLTGFYSPNQLTVSGTSNPIFNDVEIVTENGLVLNTWIGITNNANFIVGDVITSKTDSGTYLNFIDTAFFTGTGNETHVNGYAGATNKELITFPVGDGQRVRHLTLTSSAINDLAKCAYFFEDPNNPSSLTGQFNTENKEFEDLQVSNFEFWKLESNQPSVVTLAWDSNSNAPSFADSTEDLIVVGWNSTENRWESLGNTGVTGNLTTGIISSETFVPDDYEIITLGGNELLEPFSVLELDNYFLTPNNDGINDFLEIEGIENFPNNYLKIYNRYGILVYSKLNYFNEFNGISNQNTVIRRDASLASGIYFYILTVTDTKQKYQGYMYISE